MRQKFVFSVYEFVDPFQNPDGRNKFINNVTVRRVQYRSAHDWMIKNYPRNKGFDFELN